VVAIGGNALQPAGETADAGAQRRRIEATASLLADVVGAGHDLVLTHGNGPQVGNILLQNEETRHLVPPMPLDVCGAESQALVGDGGGRVVIAAGGGGIPVIRKDGKLVGVEAVIDKDLAAAVLAKAIGWKHLVIATDVPQIALDFGKPSQRFIDRLTIPEAKKYLAEGQFPPGSMGPKMEAVVDFLEHGGQHAVITDLAPALLAEERKAARQAGVKATFVQGDMRRLPYRNAFDAAISMFTSFGYFDRPAEDREVLRGIARALRPRGKFLMELFNRDSL